MTTTTDVRAALERLMRGTLRDNAEHATWTYRAVRPDVPEPSWSPWQRVRSDCSKGVQRLCRWAHAPDPMRNAWGPYGNSQTIALNLPHLPGPSDLLVGDIVTFGRYGRDHAAIVLEPGPDPLVWSHGHQGAPNAYRLSKDRREKQYLRLPVPVYVPTPEDRLRAMTGWFAWMSWGLAEGDWRGYPPFDPDVRPDVPRRIPAAWWARRLQFLASRKRANKQT